MAGIYYKSFVDPSGGRRDAAGLAIAHREGDRIILDMARRWTAPHDPAEVVGEMAEILKRYRISNITGDRYAGAWPEKEFLKHNIIYGASAKDKSAIYLEFLPLVLSGRVELLENKILFSELRALERRTRSSGRDLVDHPPKGHDDLANAVAGACVLVAENAGGEISYESVVRRRFWESDDRHGDESSHREDLLDHRRNRRTAW
jgi:hypothetical protein